MNSLLYCIRGRHEARPEVRQFRSQFKSFLPPWDLGEGPYSLSLEFHEDWYTKAGKVKRKDVPNLVKACVDALADRYSFDDSWLWDMMCRKVQSPERVGIALTLRGLNVGTQTAPASPDSPVSERGRGSETVDPN